MSSNNKQSHNIELFGITRRWGEPKVHMLEQPWSHRRYLNPAGESRLSGPPYPGHSKRLAGRIG